ncbi:MAG: glycosyltransferase family 2 protein [Chitinophagaceae bacterium]|nr:MAG: glycosyltransferase family 2 protein [Chitinophagaceae bacterium]
MEPFSQKSVAVVIPCRNEEKYIGKCLDSLIQSDFDLSQLEIYVCDGRSDDDTRKIVAQYEEKYPFIQLIDNPHLTTPHALNAGITMSETDFVVILGAHAAVDKNFIKKSVEVFELDDKIGCAGGIIENVNEDAKTAIIAAAMSSPFGVGTAYFRTGTKEGYVDTVAFGMYKRVVFEKIGLFDESLVRNQDDEFNFRLINSGFKIYLSAQIQSKYYVRASFSKLYKQYFQYGYWKVFVNKKHKTITTLRQLVPAAFVLFLFTAWLPALLNVKFIFIYIGFMLLYLMGSFYSAYRKSTVIKDMIGIMAAFFILHFSYGSGYLKGILHFYLLNKKPVSKASELSR